jgi:excisionase family DNA binding protein
MSNTTKLYSVFEVSQLLGVSPETIRYYIKNDWLKATKAGTYYVISRKDIENLVKFLEGRTKTRKKRSSPKAEGEGKATPPRNHRKEILDILHFNYPGIRILNKKTMEPLIQFYQDTNKEVLIQALRALSQKPPSSYDSPELMKKALTSINTTLQK